MNHIKNKEIGFIGLGSMGKALATNLIKEKFSLTVYDLREEPLIEMERLGARVAKNIKEVAQKSDVVIVMVLNYPQIKQVTFPPEGILSEMQRGSTLIVLSTISPLEIKEVDELAQQYGVSVIDSPVSGGQERAVDGSLVLMVGAEEQVFNDNKNILEAMGQYVYYTGRVGNGQTVKMVNQLLCGVHQIATAEALTLARKLGIDLDLLHKIICNSSGDSVIWRQFGSRMIARDFVPKGSVNTMTKDSRSVVETAIKLGVPIYISSIPYQIFRLAEARGLGSKDIASIITIFEEYAEIKM
jgi:2-hydroxy-3-oxopropionate reductase